MKKLFICVIVIGTLLVSCGESPSLTVTDDVKGFSPEIGWTNLGGHYQFDISACSDPDFALGEENTYTRFTDSSKVVFIKNQWLLILDNEGEDVVADRHYLSNHGYVPSFKGDSVIILESDKSYKTYKWYRIGIYSIRNIKRNK